MAERKAVNKYYPPEWDPSKGSINTYRNSHPLRERAKKLDEGILVIRFEMPFNIWCDGCEQMIGRGTRFNAEKKQNGNYLSSKIWQFSMKCANCKNRIIMETDPQNSDFIVKSGGRKKNEKIEFTEEDHVISFASKEEKQKLSEDTMYRLEHLKDDYETTKELKEPVIYELKQMRDEVWKDDYASSKLLRKIFRDKKKQGIQDLKQMENKYGNIFQSGAGDEYQDLDEKGKLKLQPLTQEMIDEANKVQFNRIKTLKKSTTIFGNSLRMESKLHRIAKQIPAASMSSTNQSTLFSINIIPTSENKRKRHDVLCNLETHEEYNNNNNKKKQKSNPLSRNNHTTTNTTSTTTTNTTSTTTTSTTTSSTTTSSSSSGSHGSSSHGSSSSTGSSHGSSSSSSGGKKDNKNEDHKEKLKSNLSLSLLSKYGDAENLNDI